MLNKGPRTPARRRRSSLTEYSYTVKSPEQIITAYNKDQQRFMEESENDVVSRSFAKQIDITEMQMHGIDRMVSRETLSMISVEERETIIDESVEIDGDLQEVATVEDLESHRLSKYVHSLRFQIMYESTCT